jgi:hypothetical protein
VRPIPIGIRWQDSGVRHTGSKLSAKYCAATSHLSARFFGLRAIMSPAFGDPPSLSASEMLTTYILARLIRAKLYCRNSRIPSLAVSKITFCGVAPFLFEALPIAFTELASRNRKRLTVTASTGRHWTKVQLREFARRASAYPRGIQYVEHTEGNGVEMLKRQTHNMNDPCGARCPQLPKVL